MDPPIIHGNLNCETLFIQHNGLLKIGSIAPDAIHTHVKTCKEQQKHFHFIAPEYAGSIDQPINEAVDIYSFGMCALEMAVHGLTPVGDNISITDELIEITLKTLQPEQGEFIRSCIVENPKNRPSARELLFRPILFEVHQLKLLAAHVVTNHDFQLQDNMLYKNKRLPSEAFATIRKLPQDNNTPSVTYTYGKLPQNDVEKLLEDVSQGLFPLTNYAVKNRLEKVSRVSSPEESDNTTTGDNSSEAIDPESRIIVHMTCDIQLSSNAMSNKQGSNSSTEEDTSLSSSEKSAAGSGDSCSESEKNGNGEWETQIFDISLKLKLDDNTTRYLGGKFGLDELSSLASELVDLGFINDSDRDKVKEHINKSFTKVIANHAN